MPLSANLTLQPNISIFIAVKNSTMMQMGFSNARIQNGSVICVVKLNLVASLDKRGMIASRCANPKKALVHGFGFLREIRYLHHTRRLAE